MRDTMDEAHEADEAGRRRLHRRLMGRLMDPACEPRTEMEHHAREEIATLRRELVEARRRIVDLEQQTLEIVGKGIEAERRAKASKAELVEAREETEAILVTHEEAEKDCDKLEARAEAAEADAAGMRGPLRECVRQMSAATYIRSDSQALAAAIGAGEAALSAPTGKAMLDAEATMHARDWTAIWYAHPGPLTPEEAGPRWHAGVWTGAEGDLLCVKRCETNEEAERYRSPGAGSIVGAVEAAAQALAALDRVPDGEEG